MTDDGRGDVGDDPFEEFEGHEGREGDPFAHLGSSDADPPADADSPADRRGDDSEPQTDRQPTDSGPQDTPAGGPGDDELADRDPDEYDDGDAGGYDGYSGDHAEGGSDGTAASGPPADSFEDVDPSRGDPFEAGAGAFEQVDVDGVDPDDVWAQFTGAEAAMKPEPLADDGDETEDDVEDEVVEVPKHSFCEGCEFFSPPPEVRCTHQGTSILEFVDMETVRVANCPVVDERRELGGFDAE